VSTIGAYEHLRVIDLYHNPRLDVKNAVHFKRLKDLKTGRYTNYTYPQYVNIPFNPKTDDYPYPPAAINITYDGLHPSDKGDAIIAAEVIKAFKQIGLAPKWDKYISLKQYAGPFWKADTIFDERVQLIKDGKRNNGTLLFPAKKILTVQTADHGKIFKQGKDWLYQNGKIVALAGSAMPSLNKDSILFNTNKPGMSMSGSKPGTFVLFNEDAYMPSHQLSVTYIPVKRRKWNGPAPVYNEQALPQTLTKLRSGQALTILFYGNSIEVGYNASGLLDIPPYMPTWAEQVCYNLRSVYSSKINYINTSVSGVLSKWGLDSVASRVVVHHPDVVVIGFGMNDGTAKVPPDKYREQIKGIMDAVWADNPKAEFILISPTLPNPDAIQAGLQGLYKAELQKLVKPGVVLADMTGVHTELLKHKRFQDMTGNNVNHPNDYLARWYAQIISGLLIK
jgi:lysophospholipase L1-like esterase